MGLKLIAAGWTDSGRERENNEDTIFHLVVQDATGEPLGLFIVCDGVGGQLAGDQASQMAVAAIRDSLRDLFAPPDEFQTQPLEILHTPFLNPRVPPASDTRPMNRAMPGDSLRQRVVAAAQIGNLSVFGLTRHKPEEAGNAGTTLTMALVRGSHAIVANVGDSRTYLIRDGHLQRVTKDHSLIEGLIDSGNVKPEERFTHPARNVILRSLGRDTKVDVDIFEESLRQGDILLLCSDGLWEMVRDPDEIAALARRAATPLQACRDLISAANAAGGSDNISVIVVRIE